MRFKFILLLILICDLSSNALADTTVAKEVWIAGMRDAVPAFFCKNGSYFRECFNIDAPNCQSNISESLASCITKISPEMPNKLHLPNDGESWGQRLGRCTGTLYDATLVKVKIQNERCNDPKYWK